MLLWRQRTTCVAIGTTSAWFTTLLYVRGRKSMPQSPPEIGSPADWLRYARSDLALARVARPAEVFLEMLCFHTQQAVEKSIKAVLLANGIRFPYTHDIAKLITLVNEAGIP